MLVDTTIPFSPYIGFELAPNMGFIKRLIDTY
jgi:hypothetical protein